MSKYQIFESGSESRMVSSADTIGGLSDGYHTFDELYEHRITLYIALCKFINNTHPFDRDYVWRSRKHSDGTSWEGWFLMGISGEQGEQITYHLPESRWEDADFAFTRDEAPPFDGHIPADVLKRLAKL